MSNLKILYCFIISIFFVFGCNTRNNDTSAPPVSQSVTPVSGAADSERTSAEENANNSITLVLPESSDPNDDGSQIIVDFINGLAELQEKQEGQSLTLTANWFQRIYKGRSTTPKLKKAKPTRTVDTPSTSSTRSSTTAPPRIPDEITIPRSSDPFPYEPGKGDRFFTPDRNEIEVFDNGKRIIYKNNKTYATFEPGQVSAIATDSVGRKRLVLLNDDASLVEYSAKRSTDKAYEWQWTKTDPRARSPMPEELKTQFAPDLEGKEIGSLLQPGDKYQTLVIAGDTSYLNLREGRNTFFDSSIGQERTVIVNSYPFTPRNSAIPYRVVELQAR